MREVAQSKPFAFFCLVSAECDTYPVALAISLISLSMMVPGFSIDQTGDDGPICDDV